MKRRKKKPRCIPFHQPWLQNDADTIAHWNANFPRGTMVIYECDNKKHVRARTASLAYQDHPHSPVLIDLNSRQGVVLSRVEALEKGSLHGHHFYA